jgi:phage terminase large subunit-like protein
LEVHMGVVWSEKCNGQPHEGCPHKHPRPEQVPPDDEDGWVTYFYRAGRGSGKTRAGAEWLKKQLRKFPGSRWAVLAPTSADARDTCIEGESGLLSVLPPEEVKTWNRSIGELVLHNGSRVKCFTADEPDRLRGPQHHGAWVDELSSFRYDDAWDQLQFGLRLGDRPRIFVTSTPKPTPLVKSLMSRKDGTVIVKSGSTFDNAGNLAASALEEMKRRYEGTRLGRQELYGELLLDVPGAVATYEELDACRVKECPDDWVRGITAVDPAVTYNNDSDETGITVQRMGADGQVYFIGDYTCKLPVDKWAERAVAVAMETQSGTIVYEENQGYDAIGVILRNAMRAMDAQGILLTSVHASKNKFERAMHLQQWIQQTRWHLVGSHPALEDQLTTTTVDLKGPSPNNLDSCVHGFNTLTAGDFTEIEFSSNDSGITGDLLTAEW